MLNKALISFVKLYRFLVSPLFAALGCRCRFHPTCSQYAIEMLGSRSVFQALWLIMIRLAKCAPYAEKG